MSATADTVPKVRTRVGIRGPFFLPNAATAIVYVTDQQYDAGFFAVNNLRNWLLAVAQTDLAKRLVYERS